MNIFEKFKSGLKKSSTYLSSNIIKVLQSKKISDEVIDEIESILISADIGLDVTNLLIEKIKNSKLKTDADINLILEILASEIYKFLNNSEIKLSEQFNNRPNILLFVGVNGSGKTTSIGKLIKKLDKNNKILVAACDTFRAAAVDQLKKWSNLSNVDFFEGTLHQDPASVAYSACQKVKNEKHDYLIIDTAGRLTNNTNLINQLIKINSVVQKSIDAQNVKNILVLDGTNGSNMNIQVETFSKVITISGLVITKLDGTAKGGAIISIAKKYQIPIYFIGLGENEDDLYEFDAQKFSYSLLGLNL